VPFVDVTDAGCRRSQYWSNPRPSSLADRSKRFPGSSRISTGKWRCHSRVGRL